MRLSHERLKDRVNGAADPVPKVGRFVELKPSAVGAETFADPPPMMTLRFGDATSRHVEARCVDSRCASQLMAAFFGEAVRA